MTMTPTPITAARPSDELGTNAPRRYIYNQADMERFKRSAVRRELLSFVSAMGRGLAGNSPPLPHGGYDPRAPLGQLTPALASLHGSLACISATWMDAERGGIPPDHEAKARFGNPAFRTWHARLVERSRGIVRCLMECHVKYAPSGTLSKEQMLKECSERGYRAAANDDPTLWQEKACSTESSSNQEDIVAELRAYLHDSFGHPIRIDYGTGHESSFVVFLLSLCKIGCFRWVGTSRDDQPPEAVGLMSLSLLQAYLHVTRGLQRDYMLEPAGSHGVWGLDDYHCVPFYLGACQMTAREQWQRQNQRPAKTQGNDQEEAEMSSDFRMRDNPYLPQTMIGGGANAGTHLDDTDHWDPSIIHERRLLEAHAPTYLYLSCIQFIQQIKKNVPFFESSPMLNDISRLESWSKVSSGLLRLYEGEVLDKLPVVQHFVFGNIFCADWSPSRKAMTEAPPRDLFNAPKREECAAGGVPSTRAPWAK